MFAEWSVRGGATFIRWGRRDCENTAAGSTLVYSGLAATNHYDHDGGGANFLCLDVNVSYTTHGVHRFRDRYQSISYIDGIEYRETALSGLFDYSLIEGRTFHQYNVPCSVCMSQGRVNQDDFTNSISKINHLEAFFKNFILLMIPGQDVCPGNWKKEYRGYIMGPKHRQKHSGQYICVDEKPQIVHGSDQAGNGERLYMVETQCPSIQCGPYVAGRELRCVVCTM